MLKRLWTHFLMTRWHLRGAFPPHVLQAVEQAITTAEKSHGGEIRFVVEREFDIGQLLSDVTPRQRAIQLFGQEGVWDTADNNGVLIYVSLADRDVEIVADRGFESRVTDAQWAEVCRTMEHSFRHRAFERGALEGIEGVSKLIATHYPSADGNELPNQALIL